MLMPRRQRPLKDRLTKAFGPYALMIPALALLAAGIGYPLVKQVILSTQEFGLAQQLGTAEPVGIGFDNYIELINDPELWKVVMRSLVFCLVNAALTMLVGVAVALLMTKLAKPARLFLQITMLLAWAMPVIAAMTVWQWLFDSQYGVINWLLTTLGFDGFSKHSWLLNPMSFFFVATVVVVWMSVPFVAFSAYAALTQVSGETLEAADLDGASGRQKLLFVILPSIRPVLTVVGLLQIVWDLRVFAQINFLQGVGGIPSETHLLGTYIYSLGIGGGEYGKASAIAIFMLVLTLIITAGYVRSLAKEEKS